MLLLQHTFVPADEAAFSTSVENPYWQYSCGDVCLQTEVLIDLGSLTQWSKCVGREDVAPLLTASIDVARRGGVLKALSVLRGEGIVDTTVMNAQSD